MKDRFSRQITFLPIIFIALTAGIISFVNVYELQQEKQKQIKNATTEFIEHEKKSAKERVLAAAEIIEFQHNQVERLVRKRVKERVDEAIHMATAFYEKYQKTTPRETLEEQVKLMLSNAVFDHPDGYFFAVDMHTEKINIHKVKKLVGYSMSKHKDLRGTSVLDEQKELLSRSDGAFQTIYFSKPTEPNKEFPKQIYIRYFKPFNWLIGTGEYLDDMEKRLQEYVLTRLKILYPKGDEYLFVKQMYNLQGGDGKPYASLILSSNPVHTPGQLLYDTDQDSKGTYFRRDVLELLRTKGEGFVSYWHPSPKHGAEVQKTSYFLYNKTWNWTLGSGFYYDALDEKLAIIEKSIDQKITKEIWSSLGIALFIIAVMSALFFIISRRIATTINTYAKRLQSQKQMFETLYQKATTGVILLKDGCVYDCNDAMLAMLGYEKKEEILSQEIEAISSSTQANNLSSKEAADRRIEQCMKEGSTHFEWLHQRKSGESFWCYVTLTKLIMDDGVIIHGLVQNIDARKKLEEENKKHYRRLTQQSKMAALGEMIGNIAHQWRQPLSVIAMEANNILLDIGLGKETPQETEKHVQGIINQTKQLSRTIEDFGEFFRPQQACTKFQISLLVERALKVVQLEFEKNHIKVIETIENLSGEVHVNELLQVLINLLNNAKDALENKQEGERYVFITVYKEDDKTVISVKDNAGGIDEEIIERVCEPYFTTKHPSLGTGIGLFMCQEIITKHMQGVFEINNTAYEYEGKAYRGAEFTIRLLLS